MNDDLERKEFSYSRRDAILNEIGYTSYESYLCSNLWEDVKYKTYKLLGKCCFLCDKPSTTLHHRKYTRVNLLGESTEWLSPLCYECHTLIECNDNGNKILNPFDVDVRYKEKL